MRNRIFKIVPMVAVAALAACADGITQTEAPVSARAPIDSASAAISTIDTLYSAARAPIDTFASAMRAPVDTFASARASIDTFVIAVRRAPVDTFASARRAPVDTFASARRAPVDTFAIAAMRVSIDSLH